MTKKCSYCGVVCDSEAKSFLHDKAHHSPFLSNGLNKLPFALYPAVASVMQEFALESMASAADQIQAERSNDGGTLLGNTQGSDLEWLARTLFDWSRLGAGCVTTVDWLLSREQWEHVGLTPQALLADYPRFWDALTEEHKEAWRKLGRIVMHVIPQFAERIGNRYIETAKAVKHVTAEHLRP